MSNVDTNGLGFTLAQVTKLFAMQDQLNTYIHPEWKLQQFDWHTAIVDECQEILEHTGWKWWKGTYNVGVTEANKAQIKLEVIDLLHFIVSQWAETEALPKYFILETQVRVQPEQTIIDAVKNIRGNAATYNDATRQWSQLAQLLDMTADEIMETYVQKYVLNKFRQDHGYKDGAYQKVWKISTGVCDDQFEMLEDNEGLTYVVKYAKDTTDETELYNELEKLYNSRLNKS